MQSMCWHLKSLYFLKNWIVSYQGHGVGGRGLFLKLEIWGMPEGGGYIFSLRNICVWKQKNLHYFDMRKLISQIKGSFRYLGNVRGNNYWINYRNYYLKFHYVTKTNLRKKNLLFFCLSNEFKLQWDPLNCGRGRWLKDSSYDFELSKNMK